MSPPKPRAARHPRPVAAAPLPGPRVVRLAWSERTCAGCALSVRVVADRACRVAQIARARWLRCCPRAREHGDPNLCPDLQRALAAPDLAAGSEAVPGVPCSGLTRPS